MSIESKVRKKLRKDHPDIDYRIKDDIVFLKGRVRDHDDYVNVGLKIGDIEGVEGVVNHVNWGKNEGEDEKREARRKNIFEKNHRNIKGEYDVIIIGGGVTGCFIARELSRYRLDVLVIEKEPDVSLGASRANNGMIHPGLAPSRDSLKRELNIEGNEKYDKICKELDVKFERTGSLLLITERTLQPYKRYLPGPLYKFTLKHIVSWFVKRRGVKNGVDGIEIIKNKEVIRYMEPGVGEGVVSAVHMPSTGILDPYELTIALYENADENSVDFLLDTEAVGFIKKRGRIVGVVTSEGAYRCRYCINAAGVHADRVAEMAGVREYTIHPRKGSMLLFDRETSDRVEHCLGELRLPLHPTSKGGGINPTIHGNIIWGPNAEEVESKEDTSVDEEEISSMLEKYSDIIPALPESMLIRYFSGIRAPTFTEDFIIRPAKWVDGFVHVAGIQSPGLASSPAIADRVIDILEGMGLEMVEKDDFNPKRKSIPRVKDMPKEELDERIKKEEAWGNIICTCETVSEAEIIKAIERGADSVDAVKRRTRAGMGNCQLSYCGLRIAKILARELDIPLNEVIKEWRSSKLYDGNVRGEDFG